MYLSFLRSICEVFLDLKKLNVISVELEHMSFRSYEHLRSLTTKKSWLVGVILFWLQTTVVAQQSYFKHFDVAEGLPSSNVYFAMQDSKGFIWFATDAGVSRYNGYTFENFTTKNGLGDNEIFQIFEDSQQRIWFCTYNGKIAYFYNEEFRNSSNTPVLKQVDAASYFTGITEDSQGNIWFGTERDGIICLQRTNEVIKYYTEGGGKNFIYYLYATERDQLIA